MAITGVSPFAKSSVFNYQPMRQVDSAYGQQQGTPLRQKIPTQVPESFPTRPAQIQKPKEAPKVIGRKIQPEK